MVVMIFEKASNRKVGEEIKELTEHTKGTD